MDGARCVEGPSFRFCANVGIGRAVVPGGGVEPIIAYQGRVYSLGSWGYSDVREVMLEYSPEDVELLAKMVSSSDRGLPLEAVRLLAPVEKPSKLLFVGLNYRDHAAEVGREPPPVPDIFAKTPNVIVGPGDPVIVGPESSRLDAEVELAVVIGMPARSVTVEEAGESVWGYLVANDISERGEQLLSGASQWWRGKSHDTFAPVGPLIVPRSFVKLHEGAKLTLHVSGELLQSGSTASMIHSPYAIVSYASSYTLLEPGDIIATGTPAGVGHSRSPPRYLRHGDIVEACVEGIGCISNTIYFDCQKG